MSKKTIIIRISLSAILIIVLAVSMYKITIANKSYVAEETQHKKLMKYKPSMEQELQQTGDIVNQSVIDLQNANPDITGWLTVNNTTIDYPFVWAEDYDVYLRRDIYREENISGCIFMDYRFERDFSDFNTILYGHNMNNGSMFGALSQYEDRDYFLSNKNASVNLPHKNLELEAVAYMVVDSEDRVIYGDNAEEADKKKFVSIMQEKSIHGTESISAEISKDDKFVTLSTCDYNFKGARAVLVFKILIANK